MISEEIFEKIKKEHCFWTDVEFYMKEMKNQDKSNIDIDYPVVKYDTTRVLELKTGFVSRSEFLSFLIRLSKISRGFFDPAYLNLTFKSPEDKGPLYCDVEFKLKGKEYNISLTLNGEVSYISIINGINRIIKDTKYKYYLFTDPWSYMFLIIMLTNEEAEKLRGRGWQEEKNKGTMSGRAYEKLKEEYEKWKSRLKEDRIKLIGNLSTKFWFLRSKNNK